MNQEQSKKAVRRLVAPIAGMAAAVILIYAFGANPFHTWTKICVMKEIYQVISEMDLSAIDEEDEEILQSYLGGRLDITITDEAFQPVYTSRRDGMAAETKKYIEAYQKEYREKPTAYIRKNSELRVIRLRGLVVQEQKYYVYIRKEIRASAEMIRYTVTYLCIAAGLAAGLWYLFFFRRAQRLFAQTAEAEDPDAQEAQLDRARKEFVANVSHELKTPLTVISGQVEMLQCMGDEIDRDYYFSSIREEIEKMSDMVGTLLDITIIDNKMEKMEMSSVSLTELMEYMVLKYDALFKRNRIRLQTTLAEDCRARANRMYLEQAVNNYVMNAFQHTAQGGEIRIRLEKSAAHAVISVYNEGAPVSDGDMERIWQSYYINSKKGGQERNIRNAGLGLYMVKKIADQHCGTCGVENKEHGVEFWIKLPLEPDRKGAFDNTGKKINYLKNI